MRQSRFQKPQMRSRELTSGFATSSISPLDNKSAGYSPRNSFFLVTLTGISRDTRGPSKFELEIERSARAGGVLLAWRREPGIWSGGFDKPVGFSVSVSVETALTLLWRSPKCMVRLLNEESASCESDKGEKKGEYFEPYFESKNGRNHRDHTEQ